jgi:hypothetical protein
VHCVVWHIFTNTSEEDAVSTFRETGYSAEALVNIYQITWLSCPA